MILFFLALEEPRLEEIRQSDSNSIKGISHDLLKWSHLPLPPWLSPLVGDTGHLTATILGFCWRLMFTKAGLFKPDYRVCV